MKFDPLYHSRHSGDRKATKVGHAVRTSLRCGAMMYVVVQSSGRDQSNKLATVQLNGNTLRMTVSGQSINRPSSELGQGSSGKYVLIFGDT